jgi:hypothetical protein
MNALSAIFSELWGLFVDDDSMALALVLWCGACGLILPSLVPSMEWAAPILFVGCVTILLADIGMVVRRRRSR